MFFKESHRSGRLLKLTMKVCCVEKVETAWMVLNEKCSYLEHQLDTFGYGQHLKY